MSKSKREISGRSRVDQALFGLNKFVNREIFGKKDTKYMKEYNPTVGVMYGQLPSGYKQTEDVAFKEAAKFNNTNFKIFGKPGTRKYRRMGVALASGTEDCSILVERAIKVAEKIKVN